jgi:glycosyltransferase involved in cell wall biosynthesis
MESVNSIFLQDYRPLELVVVDDGSTDGTADLKTLLEREAQKSKVSFIWLQQSNLGVSSARNYGFSASSGEYILFHDSDDLLVPNKISAHLKLFEKSKADLSAGSIYRFIKEKEVVNRYTPKVSNHLNVPIDEVVQMHWGTQAFMYRRDLIENVSWDEDLHCAEDLDFNFRVLQQDAVVCLAEDAITYVREGNEVHRLTHAPNSFKTYMLVRQRIMLYYRSRNEGQFEAINQAILLRSIVALWRGGERAEAKRYFLEVQPFAPGVVAGGVGEKFALALRNCWLFCTIRALNERLGEFI